MAHEKLLSFEVKNVSKINVLLFFVCFFVSIPPVSSWTVKSSSHEEGKCKVTQIQAMFTREMQIQGIIVKYVLGISDF